MNLVDKRFDKATAPRLLWVTSDLVELAAGPAMSASHPKRPSAMKMRSVAKGPEGDIPENGVPDLLRPLFATSSERGG